MFRIKICGVTRPQDAATVAAAGADAIGLNFYPKSSRFVDVTQASAIREAARGLLTVGVFVNAETEQIRRIAQEVGLSAVQLHGEEPPETIAALDGLPVILARRVGVQGVDPIERDLNSCDQAGRRPDALLLDAAAPGAYGGTGTAFDWAQIEGDRSWLGSTPLILAGGLTPANVAAAIDMTRPYGVDTASGVESSPGVKDPGCIAAFVEAAKGILPPTG